MSHINKSKPLSSLLDNYFAALGMSDKLYTARIVNNWSDIVGPAVSKYTLEIFVQKGLLYVKINSPALKQELNYIKDEIKNKINEYLNKTFIKGLVIY